MVPYLGSQCANLHIQIQRFESVTVSEYVETTHWRYFPPLVQDDGCPHCSLQKCYYTQDRWWPSRSKRSDCATNVKAMKEWSALRCDTRCSATYKYRHTGIRRVYFLHRLGDVQNFINRNITWPISHAVQEPLANSIVCDSAFSDVVSTSRLQDFQVALRSRERCLKGVWFCMRLNVHATVD